jgi:hypothetical protein
MELLKLLKKKYSVKPPGIDPGTHRLVAQRLNHYATPDPKLFLGSLMKYSTRLAKSDC